MSKNWASSLLFKKSSESTTVINIGNYYLKGLLVKGNTITDYFLEKNTNLSETLKKVWEEKKMSSDKVKLSLKSPACLVRYFPFPKMDKKKLHQALFFEMNKFIPFSPEEVYFDYSVLKDSGPNQLTILLAVAKKDLVDNILAVFRQMNVRISEITLDSICLVNLFLANNTESQSSNNCILDIGYKFSTMTIINKGVPFLTRDVKLNTKDIFQIISRIKDIPIDSVNNWLSSLKTSEEFLELSQDSISNLCKEMKNSFDYFEVNSGEHINKLYLTGGLSCVKNISRPFNEYLDTDVDILVTFPKDKSGLGPVFSEEKFASLKNSFAVSFGLIS
ncbi:MAG: pilus assembly protein PilM [Candidatus Omnitrophica bacterium]|nr:pilus assembly protein PilM [Candidatus Omnitrophota bacterium]